MKKLILTFLFTTLIFSSPSYADWTKAGTNINGSTYYVDFDRIRKQGGYVYWWELSDYLKPISGVLSGKLYKQGDCKVFRFKILSDSYYKEPMINGTPFESSNTPDKEWTNPPPDSIGETVLKKVCNYWVSYLKKSFKINNLCFTPTQ